MASPFDLRRFVSRSEKASHLQADASRAARGDAMALQRFFAEVGPDAWDLAYASTMSTARAAEAVTDGLVETLTASADTELADVRKAVLNATNNAAFAIDLSGDRTGVPKTPNPEATATLIELSREERTALWLVEGTGVSAELAAQITESNTPAIEAWVESAREKFASPDGERASLLREAIPQMPEWIAELVWRAWPVSGSVWWAQRRWRSLIFG